MKPVWLGGTQSTDSDRLGMVLSGERGESPAWWGLVEEVRRRAGPMKSRRRSVTGRKGCQGRGAQHGALGPREAFRGTFKGSFVTSRAGICSFQLSF